MSIRSFAIASLCCVLSNVGCVQAARPTVTIASGVIVGTTTTLPSATAAVNQYLGVPFAQSPPLRFAPPESPAAWSTSLDASQIKPACVQQFAGVLPFAPAASQSVKIIKDVFNIGSPAESEDCLYLNIYAPNGTAPAGGWPVMFWIYGGNLQFGDAGLSFYDGSSFATNQDVVVVTTNYRTNGEHNFVAIRSMSINRFIAFGFPGSPEIPAGSNNVGFLDQRKALQWVSDNIDKFGGGSDKITIFGESAGGYSVKNLMALPPSPMNFRGAIMESEAALVDADATLSWNELASKLNCTTAASKLACVRSKPATSIQNIIDANEISFPPIADGVTHVSNVAPSITKKTFANVPFMIGTNANEGRIFSYIIGVEPLSAANITGYLETILPGQPALQKLVAASYPVGAVPYLVVSDVLTKLAFQCPAKMLSNLAVSSGYKVWRYYFDAPFPNNMPLPDLGSYHTTEILQVFGTYFTQNSTAQQIALSKYMQTAWANFAKDPSNGPGWVELGSATKDVANLGGNGNFGETDITQESIDYECPIYAAVLTAEGI